MNESWIEIGTWGNFATLIFSVDDNSFQLISSVEIQEDQYGHPFFPFEYNSFVKVKRVSRQEQGKWVYPIRDKQTMIEIFRKLKNHGYPFNLNPELPKILKKFFASKEARDITTVSYIISATNSIVPATI